MLCAVLALFSKETGFSVIGIFLVRYLMGLNDYEEREREREMRERDERKKDKRTRERDMVRDEREGVSQKQKSTNIYFSFKPIK